MPTLVLPPRYTSDSIDLWRAAVQAGWDIERLQSWHVPMHLRDREIVLYGEPVFAAIVADALDLALLEPSFDWVSELPYAYRQRDIRFATLEHARKHETLAFFKPADDKCFPAGVYDSGNELPTEDVLPGTIPVLIAEPVSWEVEFRCFVLECEVVTLSPYARHGMLAQAEDGTWPASTRETDQVLEFSSGVINDPHVHLPPSVVLDVGIITGRGWAAVEANPSWASGIYGCDPMKVLQVISRACIRRDHVRADDKVWIIDRST